MGSAIQVKHRGVSMSKPARGTKRVCPSCGARFYDLSRSPIVCPVCQTAYQVTPASSRRSERAAPVEVRKVVEEETKQPVRETAQVISLGEAEEETNPEATEDEEIVDLGEDGAEIPADEDDTFLEQEEEGEADVSGIVDGGREEET
jgi:uncharacterized protein (TIGR02300 family)